jgi:hypothetical protein
MEKLISYVTPSPLTSVLETLGAGASDISMQVFTAAVRTDMHRSGSSLAARRTLTDVALVVVGRLWLTKRDLAMTLLGTIATSRLMVAICVERQLIWITLPSIPPSTQTRSPAL